MNWTPPDKPPFEEYAKHTIVSDTPWERMEYGARQTGRTHRMIDKALEMHEKGRAVYILVRTQREALEMRRRFNLPHTINIETPRTINTENIDWQNMRPSLNAWPNTALLVDHFYIEDVYRDMLRELHNYDWKPEVTK